MNSNYIFNTSLSNYRPLLWSGGHVYKQNGLIKNYLKKKLGEEYADLFSVPIISDNDLIDGNNVTWNCLNFTQNTVPFTSLPSERKKIIQQIIEDKLTNIQDCIFQLQASGDPENLNWADLLQQSLKLPSLDCILVEGEKIILVLWGFESIKSSNNPTQLLKYFNVVTHPNKFEKVIEKKADQQSLSGDVANDGTLIQKENNTDLKENKITSNEDQIRNESSNSTSHTTSNSNEANTRQQENGNQTHSNENNFIPNNLDQRNNPNKKDDNSKIIYANSKRNIIILILTLLFILFIFFFIQSQKKQEITYLPVKNAEIIPIDTTKIIKNPDGATTIVSDRINIALLGQNKSILSFSKAFKEQYPGDQYKIIYYDTNIHRIQILVPSEERVDIKNNIDKKIKGFELLVWEETIFNNRRTFNDPVFNNINQSWYLKAINVEDAWDKTLGDSTLVIAIIDDGFDITNPDFTRKIYKPRNIPEGNNAITINENSPHGTHVAGTSLAASNNRFGSTGIAPNCKFMPIQVWDKNGIVCQTYIIDGILYAINNGASVINLSLGTELDQSICSLPPDQQENIIKNQFKSEEKFWDMLFKEAYDKNVTVVMAAGNQNIMIGIDPFQRSKYTIKVSAVDPDIEKASFSNYGNYSTISAPGVSIYNDAPDGEMAYLDGTSMASPIVAGAVALIKSVHPAYSFEQIIDVLQSTGLNVGTNDKHIGNLIQLDKALDAVKQNRDEEPTTNCENIQHQIDSLKLLIKRLENNCKNM
jgi:subtilisin family serine protease